MYATEVNQGGVNKIQPNGKVTPLLFDPKLLHRAELHHGTNAVNHPIMIYTTKINVGPSPIDHQ